MSHTILVIHQFPHVSVSIPICGILRIIQLKKFIYDEEFFWFVGQVDQLEDRYLGMVEAASSNLALSTILRSITY